MPGQIGKWIGNVSDQATDGEQVTLHIVKPDGTTDQIMATTKPDKTFASDDYNANQDGTWSVTPEIAADSKFKPATGTTFQVSLPLLADRAIAVSAFLPN